MLAFPSTEWVSAFASQINASPAYRTSSLTWEAGSIALVAERDAELGLDDGIAVWLDLHHGECRSAQLLSVEEAEAAAFVIRGTYQCWKSVLRREIGPVKAMILGKLTVQGSMVTIMRYMKGAQEFVECGARVPTRFLDE